MANNLPSSISGSGSLLLNMLATNPADQCLPIASDASLPGNMKKAIATHQLSPSDVLTEVDDRRLLGRWYEQPSENIDVDAIQGSVDMPGRHVCLRSQSEQTCLMFDPGSVNKQCVFSVFKGNSSAPTSQTSNAAGSISDRSHCLDSHNGVLLIQTEMDVKPVLSTDMLHGKGQREDIYIHSPGIVPSVVSPLVPSVGSQPSISGQVANICLPSLSPQSSHPQYYRQQQPQVVTTVKTTHCQAMAQSVFAEIKDACDQVIEENRLRILNELQLRQFGSQEVLLDFEYGQYMPSDQNSSTEFAPNNYVTFETEANALRTSPVQNLPKSGRPINTSSSVTTSRYKSTDATGKSDCGDESITKDLPKISSLVCQVI
ncbi:hypothetical protein DPMN_110051 [Dreissena polymorpha]|uniref:Uncharacterized protein n=1 Tax=Dreissena polymorpha TaxID=45954 RepID=A0A9D4KBV8_DREPO|nr:hypothetical protein DPMN_110051 [Dreissena polymorpha]